MTTNQAPATAAGAVPAARGAPDDSTAVALPGSPFPLGATPGTRLGIAGTNFALASSVADSVTLCLFDAAGAETPIPLRDNDKPSTLDSAGHVPRSLVTDPQFGWQDGNRPWHRYADTVLYEIHVKGFTMRHPDIPPELQGTYAGLGHQAAIAHLRDLGVTTVELLPVHQNVPESFLAGRGLTNYWGYNTIGFFAPHNGYSAAARAGQSGGQVSEFKAMVDALHRAGLEVVRRR
jgi:pullulanase/glycogen debranching enzyme